MKKQYGEIMNNEQRQTQIVDEEIIIDELQDKIFDKLRDALVDEARLVKKFYNLCSEFNNFEYDEMGINMEEADDILRKANKIRDKLLNLLIDTTGYKFENIKTDEVYYKILFDIIVEDEVKHCIIESDIDSFDLEVY